MAHVDEYDYFVELLPAGGGVLPHGPIAPDWDPAVDWTWLAGIRAGLLDLHGSGPGGTITPAWDGPGPYLRGVDVGVTGPDGRPVQRRIPLAYFKTAARQARAAAVEQGRLKTGETVNFRVLARPRSTAPAAACDALAIEVERLAPPLRVADVAQLGRSAVARGTANTDDIPVYLPQGVLDEAAQLTEAAGADETGGVLIGHLCRAADGPELAVQVTGQIPASHVEATTIRLTFTAETWSAVRDALARRGAGELLLGWWHSHSYLKTLCADCAERQAGHCRVTAAFLSEEDCLLHRAVFPQPYSVALVLSASPCSGLQWALFGWRYGVIVSRGFHVLNAPERTPAAAPKREEVNDAARP